jgi:hypothetical protein
MTAIFEAYNALVASVRFILPDIQVLDGAPVVELENDTIMMGYADDRKAIMVDTDREGLGNDDREQFEIANTISVASGDTDFVLLRARAKALYTPIVTMLRNINNTALSGIVLRAVPMVADLDQDQTDRGAEVTLVFIVVCDAFG